MHLLLLIAGFGCAWGYSMDIVESSESAARFAPQPPAAFSPTKSTAASHTLFLDPTAKGQVIMGFGGAFTDSVAAVFSSLNTTRQEEVLELLWGMTGNRLTLARLTIGSTDFSTSVYNYNEPDGIPLATPDFDQTNFSIAHDNFRIIPLIQRAQAVARKTSPSTGGLRFLSSPWSPPGWMKVPYLAQKGHMRNSAKPGMIDDPKMYASYALYLSKYVSAYKSAGINISMMTIQNEPDSADHMFPVSYPACNFNGTGEGEFLRDYLGPQMSRDHPDVRIFVHDGQKFHDVPILRRVKDIMAAAGAAGRNFIKGVAFHWYGNNLANYQYLQELHDAFPDLPLLATEATLEVPAQQKAASSPWKEAQKYGVDIIGDLNAGATGCIEWNVLLDGSGGPTCIGTTAGLDCIPLAGHCDAPLLADAPKQSLEIRDAYYFMGHFSRYIMPGASRIGLAGGTDTNTTFMATAAQNPNGDIVIVALNTDQSNPVSFQVQLAQQYAPVTMPPHSIQTLTVAAASLQQMDRGLRV